MEKLTEVLAMGGYAAYVWPAFGITFALLLGMVVISLRSLKAAQRLLAALQSPPPDEA